MLKCGSFLSPCLILIGLILAYAQISKAKDVATSGIETTHSSGACPENFFSVGHTNKCFYLGDTAIQKFNWTESRQACNTIQWSQDVTLASINTQLELDVATMLLSTMKDDGDVWIDDRGHFKWSRNRALASAGLTKGQSKDNVKSGKAHECISMTVKSPQGTDVAHRKMTECSKRNAYLCETTKDDSKTPTGSLTSLPGSSPPSETCPDGYSWFKSACFSLKMEISTWEEARATCQKEGGDLASTLDAFEVANINFNMHLNAVNIHCWIGLRYNADSFKFTWANGSPMTREFWDEGEPNLYDEVDRCVAFKGSWDDRSCNETKPYICQKRLAPKPELTTRKSTSCSNSNAQASGDHCYVARPDDIKTWKEAAEACLAMGMQLVSLHSVAETEFVQNLVKNQTGASWRVWVGLLNGVDGFRWTDGTPFDFEHWSAKNPTFTWEDEDVECVEMLQYGYWSDASCKTKQGYVCKTPEGIKDIVPVTPALIKTSSGHGPFSGIMTEDGQEQFSGNMTGDGQRTSTENRTLSAPGDSTEIETILEMEETQESNSSVDQETHENKVAAFLRQLNLDFSLVTVFGIAVVGLISCAVGVYVVVRGRSQKKVPRIPSKKEITGFSNPNYRHIYE